MLRFGIVGCGAIHSTHAQALEGIEGAKLSAFFDIDPGRSAAASERFGATCARSWEEFLGLADAVVICVPSGLHAEIGIAAAQAGKHVVVEKPIDVSLATATQLVKAARTAKVKLTTISQHRFAKDIRALRDAAQSGELGTLIQGDAYNKWFRAQAYYNSADWRGTWKLDGGGCLMNQGIHYVDMIQWIMGGVKSVQAQIRTAAHDIEVEDTANVLVEYRNGAVGVIQGSTATFPGMAERLEVHGTFGSVVIEADRIKVWRVDSEAANDGSPYGAGVTQQPTPKVHLHDVNINLTSEDATTKWGNQHQLQLTDFVQAVADNRDPYLTGEMSLEPLKVVLAIYESARNDGKKVEIL